MPLKNGFRKILKNSVATLITRGLPGGVKSILFIMIARTYDPKLFGIFALVMATLEVFRVVADIGIGTTTLRRFARNEPVFKTALVINICSSFTAYLCAVLFIALFYRDSFYTLLMLIGGISLFISSVSNTFYSYYHAKLSMHSISGLTVYGALLCAVLTGLVLYYRLPVHLALLSLTLTEAISLALIALRTFKKEEIISSHSKQMFFGMLRETLPLFFSGIFSVLYLRTNIFILSFYKGEEAVADYAAVDFIIAPFILVCSALSPSFFAIFSNPENRDSIGGLFRKYLICTVAVVSVFPLVITLFSDTIVETFISRYNDANKIFLILGWATFLKVINMFFAQLVFSFGLFKQVSALAILLFVSNAGFGLFFIPIWSARGAAVALGLTELIHLAVMVYMSSRILGNSELRKTVKGIY